MDAQKAKNDQRLEVSVSDFNLADLSKRSEENNHNK
jgi:hypothetical protein